MREFPEVRLELEEESGGGDGEKRLSRWDDGDDAKGAIIRAGRVPRARWLF